MYNNMRDFRLSPQCSGVIRSSGMLHSVGWWLVSDVSGNPIGGAYLRVLDRLTLENGTDLLPRNVPTTTYVA